MDNASSYVLYMFIFTISILFSWKYDRNKSGDITLKRKIFYCILITIPVIFLQGFRYDVGTDYFNYRRLYEGIVENNYIFLSNYTSEPIFVYLCKFVYFVVRGDSTAFFVIDAILMNVILFFVFDYYKDQASLPFMYFMYYLLCFPIFLNAERQGLAVIIVWFSFRYVHEKKLIKFICFILIATLLHNTAIIGLVFYFLNFLEGKYISYIKAILVLGVAFAPLIFKWSQNFLRDNIAFFQRYVAYLKTESLESLGTNVIYMIIMVAVLFVFIKILKKSKIDYFWILFLCVAQLATYFLNFYIDWGSRLSFYFEFGMIYAHSYIYSQLKLKFNKIVYLFFIIIAVLFYFTYLFYLRGAHEIFPYHFVWNQ